MKKKLNIIKDTNKKFKPEHKDRHLLTVEEYAASVGVTARGRIYDAIKAKILTPTYIGKCKKLFIDPVINQNVKFIVDK